jgi:hypothetical protein
MLKSEPKNPDIAVSVDLGMARLRTKCFVWLLKSRTLLIHGVIDNCGNIYEGGADKSLARPGKKQATATEDFEFHISYL